MKRTRPRAVIFVLSLLFLTGCDALQSLINPFIGEWESGIFRLSFESDKSFKFAVGEAISINLEGTYRYDETMLTLNFNGESIANFTYQFKQDNKQLLLRPESDFKYIKSEILFEKKE